MNQEKARKKETIVILLNLSIRAPWIRNVFRNTTRFLRQFFTDWLVSVPHCSLIPICLNKRTEIENIVTSRKESTNTVINIVSSLFLDSPGIVWREQVSHTQYLLRYYYYLLSWQTDPIFFSLVSDNLRQRCTISFYSNHDLDSDYLHDSHMTAHDST